MFGQDTAELIHVHARNKAAKPKQFKVEVLSSSCNNRVVHQGAVDAKCSHT